MISQTAEYALRAAAALGRRPEEAMTIQVLARETRLPAGYLAKVLQTLTRGGIVRSRRGVGGGFSLARPPARITLLDIVNAVDPIRRICACPAGRPEHRGKLCALHRRLDEAVVAAERIYGSTTVAHLAAEPAGR